MIFLFQLQLISPKLQKLQKYMVQLVMVGSWEEWFLKPGFVKELLQVTLQAE